MPSLLYNELVRLVHFSNDCLEEEKQVDTTFRNISYVIRPHLSFHDLQIVLGVC